MLIDVATIPIPKATEHCDFLEIVTQTGVNCEFYGDYFHPLINTHLMHL